MRKLKEKINKFAFRNVNKFLILVPILSLVFSNSPVLAQEDATSSVRDLVREKVKEQIDVLLKKPRAAFGRLDEVTDSTLRIEAQNGKAELVSTGKDTTYVRVTTNKKSSAVEFPDLVLGDFLVAMGYKSDNNVLLAERIIAYEENPIEGKESVYGIATQVTKNSISIQEFKSQEIWTAKITKNTKITKRVGEQTNEIKMSDIKKGDRVIMAGLLDTKTPQTIEAGRIHIISGN